MNEKQAMPATAGATMHALVLLLSTDDGGAVILQAMSVVVQTLQTVIRVSQATISERASRAARLYRDSG